MTVFEMYTKYGLSAGESGYGKRWDGVMHYGVDMPTPVGVDIHAHMDARIKLMGFYDANKAGYICFEALDGSHAWLVAHVSAINTYKPIGSTVKAGDWLGKTGATGNVTGPHAHWEYYVGNFQHSITWMQQNGKTRDPLPIIQKGAVPMFTKDQVFDNCFITQAEFWPGEPNRIAWRNSGLEPYTWVQRYAPNEIKDKLNAANKEIERLNQEIKKLEGQVGNHDPIIADKAQKWDSLMQSVKDIKESI